MTTKNILSALAASAALTLLATAAQAQSSNLGSWTAAGDVTVGAPGSAVLTTAAVDSGETPVSANSALQYFELEPALFLTGGALAADTFEGSGLQSAFTAAPGASISFSWSLATVGYDAAFADRAFVVLGGSTIVPLGTVAATPVSGSFSYTFAAGGAQTFAVVLMDVNDYVGVSTLNITNFSATAVPEPRSLALMALGLAAVAGLARRRQSAA